MYPSAASTVEPFVRNEGKLVTITMVRAHDDVFNTTLKARLQMIQTESDLIEINGRVVHVRFSRPVLSSQISELASIIIGHELRYSQF